MTRPAPSQPSTEGANRRSLLRQRLHELCRKPKLVDGGARLLAPSEAPESLLVGLLRAIDEVILPRVLVVAREGDPGAPARLTVINRRLLRIELAGRDAVAPGDESEDGAGQMLEVLRRLCAQDTRLALRSLRLEHPVSSAHAGHSARRLADVAGLDLAAPLGPSAIERMARAMSGFAGAWVFVDRDEALVASGGGADSVAQLAEALRELHPEADMQLLRLGLSPALPCCIALGASDARGTQLVLVRANEGQMLALVEAPRLAALTAQWQACLEHSV